MGNARTSQRGCVRRSAGHDGHGRHCQRSCDVFHLAVQTAIRATAWNESHRGDWRSSDRCCRIAAVVYWFEPQALFLDETVDDVSLEELAGEAAPAPDPEQAPTTAASAVPDDEPTATPAPSAPARTEAEPATASAVTTLASGNFTGRSRYSAEGTAILAEVGGRNVLRLDELAVDNGPDLVIYLASADADASDEDISADFIELGELSGNVGSQNFELSPDIDVQTYDTVVIWCRRFSVGFATAPLATA